MFNDVGKLIYITNTSDSDGYPIETEVKTDVFCNKKSVKYNMKFAAMAVGKVPTIVFEIRIEDWEATKQVINGKAIYASKFEYDGAIYEIITDYSDNQSIVSLTCG